MMNWWLDRGVDGFRMDVINFISKDTSAAGRTAGRGNALRRRRSALHLRTAHPRVSAGDAPGGLRGAGQGPADSGRDAGRHRRGRRPVHRPRPRPRWTWCSSSSTWHSTRRAATSGGPRNCCSPTSRSHWAAGRKGWPSAAGTASTGATTTRPAPSPASATTAEYRELSAKMLAAVLHLHRGTPYVYQGEELGMTNMAFGAISDYRDIEVLNHHREATTHLGHTDAEVLAALAPLNRDNARTPVQWDASRHGGFTTGTPWIAVNPNYQPHQRRRPGGRPGFGLRLLPPGDRPAACGSGGRVRRFHHAAARRRTRLCVHTLASGR